MAAVLFVVGLLLVLADIVMAIMGIFIPPLIALGLLLLIALPIERWRHKPVMQRQPKPDWTDTGERFIDLETSKLTAVYLDPAKGERHYIAIDWQKIPENIASVNTHQTSHVTVTSAYTSSYKLGYACEPQQHYLYPARRSRFAE